MEKIKKRNIISNPRSNENFRILHIKINEIIDFINKDNPVPQINIDYLFTKWLETSDINFNGLNKEVNSFKEYLKNNINKGIETNNEQPKEEPNWVHECGCGQMWCKVCHG